LGIRRTRTKLLGEIARLQIQRSSLTIGSGPARYFAPAALLVVDEVFLTPSDACASRPTEAASWTVTIPRIPSRTAAACMPFSKLAFCTFWARRGSHVQASHRSSQRVV